MPNSASLGTNTVPKRKRIDNYIQLEDRSKRARVNHNNVNGVSSKPPNSRPDSRNGILKRVRTNENNKNGDTAGARGSRPDSSNRGSKRFRTTVNGG